MPRIFDNIEQKLDSALTSSLQRAQRADFCVGYFNLRGWRLLHPYIEAWQGGEANCVRLLVGMQQTPREELRELYRISRDPLTVDAQEIKRRQKKVVEDFRQQLTLGAPNNADEKGLRDLVRLLRDGKLVVKLYLRHALHAKLYLLHRDDGDAPVVGYLGSSNLTFSGLSGQGELNTDIGDYDAAQKLKRWFEERWEDDRCLDITQQLIAVIEESWAREIPLSPYELYLKIAYHLAQEAIAGVSGGFRLPRLFDEKLFDYQKAAVKIAAHHVNKRGGVLLGDVVGLGKTLMATAVAAILEEQGAETLVICPKNLTAMWENVVYEYKLRAAKVVSISKAPRVLPDLPRYRTVIIDESHNLRNAEGQRYAAIKDYLERNDSKVILLTATPYNKTYLDLSAQLKLFVAGDTDVGISPENYIRALGGAAVFTAKHQANPRTLAAFERSSDPDDWRELMRLYMVRRTRGFILHNYASVDPATNRYYLTASDGKPRYFPVRTPKTVVYESNAQYERLYADTVVDSINELSLPRYGLGQYIARNADKIATAAERAQIENLGKAGKRLMGFCRTNLFKRLESSGDAFLLSIDRHILRNFVFLHALENKLPLPIGTLDADQLDMATVEDEDENSLFSALAEDEETEKDPDVLEVEQDGDPTTAAYRRRAGVAYALLQGKYKKRFKWLRAELMSRDLATALRGDCDILLRVLAQCGLWNPEADTKLAALYDLIETSHPREKVLLFSQFADTVRYLGAQMEARAVKKMVAVTGQTDDPTAIATRFSPRSNGADARKVPPGAELRVLLTTDVLSEGQNLQDGHIVINYDLPWAIIRLSQRAGRVDRIGQQAEQILCYSFLPAEGVERIIRLRQRVRDRLIANGEVIGSDERFGVEEGASESDGAQVLRDLYTEKTTILDLEPDSEVDLASYAYQIWLNATKENAALGNRVTALPDVVYTTRRYVGSPENPPGVIVYVKTGAGSDALTWLDERKNVVTQSQLAILRAAECPPDTPAVSRHPEHHALVTHAVELIGEGEVDVIGGQLGAKSGARRRLYERLNAYQTRMQRDQPLFANQELARVIDEIYRSPLRETAKALLNRQMRSGISDEELAALSLSLRAEDKLTVESEEPENEDPRIVCSLGLFDREE